MFSQLKCLAVASLLSGMLCFSAEAQDKECATVKDCAQQMVDSANELKRQNIVLMKRIEELEKALAQQKVDIAAALEVRIKTLIGGPEQPRPGFDKRAPCPEGYYAAGVLLSDGPGGPHGIVHAVGPLCKAFK